MGIDTITSWFMVVFADDRSVTGPWRNDNIKHYGPDAAAADHSIQTLDRARTLYGRSSWRTSATTPRRQQPQSLVITCVPSGSWVYQVRKTDRKPRVKPLYWRSTNTKPVGGLDVCACTTTFVGNVFGKVSTRPRPSPLSPGTVHRRCPSEAGMYTVGIQMGLS